MTESKQKPNPIRELIPNNLIVKLQFSLNFIFLALILIFSVIVYGFTYYSSQQQLNELSRAFTENISSIIQRSLKAIVTRTVAIGEGISVSVSDENNLSLDNTIIINQLFTLLDENHYISRVSFGLENGNFFSAINLLTSDIKYFNYHPTRMLPQDAVYAIRQITYSKPIGGDVWQYYNSQFQIITEESSNAQPFDVREYSWYMLAKQWPDSNWDNTTITGGDDKVLSYVVPQINNKNQFYGAVRIVISWDKLNNLINLQKVGKTGWAFLINKEGELLSPKPGEELAKEGIIAEIKSKISLNKKINTQISLDYNNQSFLVNLTSIPMGRGFGWILGLVAPLDDIYGPFLEIENNKNIISLILLFIFGVIIYYLSRFISSPITNVANQVDQVKNFNFEEPKPIKSRIWEIITLSESVKSMRSALRLFAKYIPNELVRAMMKSKDTEFEIMTERKDMTIVFSDIENFTTVSEEMPTEKLITNLSEYFRIFSKIIHKNEGTIDKYIGDSMMAFWNAPLNVLDHGEKACLAALEFAKATNLKSDPNPLIKQKTRFGIHSGEVLVGNIGTEERLNYTVVGNAVNTASRLEKLNKVYGTKLLISETTHEKIGLRFITRPVDYIVVKGRSRGITIFELKGLREKNQNISATDDEIKLCEEFTRGFQAFQTGKLQEAKAIFNKVHVMFPEDLLTKIYLEKLGNTIDK
jgi:adenylate cyclase